jgi:hypothetical protein
MKFNDHFSGVENNVFNLVLLKNDLKYFYSASDELQKVFRRFPLISRIRNMTTRVLVISIYVAIKERESYSIWNILKKSKKQEGYTKPQREKVNKLINQLRELEKSSVFQEIDDLRNKKFAHLDLRKDQIVTSITNGDLTNLVEEIEQIFRQAKLTLYQSDISFVGLNDSKGHHLYHGLLVYNRLNDLLEEMQRDNREAASFNELTQMIF